tara:strand:- start:894 stop:1292 length:399 start_codon:yes stop_codon:yes gene_type:complete
MGLNNTKSSIDNEKTILTQKINGRLLSKITPKNMNKFEFVENINYMFFSNKYPEKYDYMVVIFLSIGKSYEQNLFDIKFKVIDAYGDSIKFLNKEIIFDYINNNSTNGYGFFQMKNYNKCYSLWKFVKRKHY